MGRFPSIRFFFSLALFVSGFGGGVEVLHAAVHDRIMGAADGGRRVSLAHMIAPKATIANDLGELAPDTRLEDLTLHFNRTAAQQAALDQLLVDQQNPGSTRYHQWLTPEQFGAQFGLSAGDLAKVSGWLTAQGFTVTGTSRSSNFITLSGTAGQVAQAFGTTLHRVSLEGELHRANLTEPVLPEAIAGVVEHIGGLSDFRLKSRARRRVVAAPGAVGTRPVNTITTPQGTTEHLIAPGDFYTIYDLSPLLTGGTSGSGVAIAVMGQVDLSASDIAAFRTASGLSATPVATTTYGTDPGSPTSACLSSTPPSNCVPSADDLSESLLDVEWAGATAPGASIQFVNSTDVLGVSLVRAISNNIAPIITVSYGDCETNYSISARSTLTNSLQQANSQGITVFGPAGDSGATDCDFNVSSATHGLTVDFPASSPNVTAVGGTQFSEGTASYWTSANGANGGSATSYIPEMVWNETKSNLAAGATQFGSGGGGKSAVFAKPTWQVGAGVPNDSARDVPDVSLNAAASHDGYIVCALGSCSGGTYSSGGNINVFGGTSVATPAFAGILALVEQKSGGTRLGNINPTIYGAANNASLYSVVFHDVTAGNNYSPCTPSSTQPSCGPCPVAGSFANPNCEGYTANVGYDLATGWGSIDGAAFVNDLGTSVAITSSQPTPLIGQNVTLTATVASGIAGQVPSGTVSFTINGTTIPPVAVSSTGTASYTTSFTSGGVQTVTAVYTGDGSHFGASASSNFTVYVVTGVATATILSASASTVALGSALTLTANVSSAFPGALKGTVTFYSAGATALGTVTVVPTSAGNAGTAVLTLNAASTTLQTGSNSVTAIYGGGGTPTGGVAYLASTSNAITVTVTNPTITVTAAGIAAADGSSATTTVTVTSGGGYSGTLNLTANSSSSTLTTNGTASFSPSSLTLTQGGSGTSTLTLGTPPAQLRKGTVAELRGITLWEAGGGLSMAGLVLLGLGGKHRRRLPVALLVVLAFVELAAIGGCASNSTVSKSFPVPQGTYQVVITATDGTNSSLVGSTTVTFTVQ